MSIICFSNLCFRYQRWLRRARTEDFSHFARLKMVYQSGLFVCLPGFASLICSNDYAICYAGQHDWHCGESACIPLCSQSIAACVGPIYFFSKLVQEVVLHPDILVFSSDQKLIWQNLLSVNLNQFNLIYWVAIKVDRALEVWLDNLENFIRW